MTDVKTASITKLWHSLPSKPMTYKTKYFVLLFVSHQPMVIPSFIQIREFIYHKHLQMCWSGMEYLIYFYMHHTPESCILKSERTRNPHAF
jgi:hypothetical protein